MKQMEMNTDTALQQELSCMILGAIKSTKQAEYIPVHSGMEAYGMVTLRFREITDLYKKMKKKMDEIADSLNGGVNTPAKLADTAATAALLARASMMMAASAENGMEELAKDGTREG